MSYKVIDRRGTNLGRPAKKPMALGTGLYATPRNTGQSDWYVPRQLILGDIGEALNSYDRQEMLTASRQLYAQLGNVSGAVNQKNLYAVGGAWNAQYTGQDALWGETAERWLIDEWYGACDIRGEPFDFVTGLFLDGIAMDVDGDAAMILTESEDQYPMIGYFPSHRIGDYYSQPETLTGGAFSGAKRRNGVVFNRLGRAIGYSIIGEDGKAKDVSAFNCQLLYEPEWQAQDRGIPRVAKGMLDLFDIQDIQTFLKRQVKQDSSIGIMHHNETGEADPAADFVADKDATDEIQDVKLEKREGGEWFYFKAGSGSKLEPYRSDRPHPNIDNFVIRLEMQALQSVGWFRQLLDPSSIGGASVRMIQDEARHSIKARQKSRHKRAKRAVLYAVAKAMKTGRLPRNDNDWWKWEFQLPPELTVDEGYSEQAERESLKMGTTTRARVCGRNGQWWEDVDAQREREVRSLITRAQAIASDLKVDLSIALGLMGQPWPNPLPVQDAGKSEQKGNK